MDDDTPRAGAALSGGANCAKNDGASSQVEIGALRHNYGIVSAEFEESSAKAL